MSLKRSGVKYLQATYLNSAVRYTIIPIFSAVNGRGYQTGMSLPSKSLYNSLSPLSDRGGGIVTFTSKENAPPDAVPLSRDEARRYQFNLVSKWRPRSDVWALRYGPTVSAIAASAGGVVLNTMFRRHFFLRNLGWIATSLPNIAMPGMMALGASMMVLDDVLLMDTRCVVCTQTQAVAWQLGVGVLYPCFMAPLSCLAIAVRCSTYPVPDWKTSYRHILADIHKVFQKNSRTMAGLAAFQCVVAFATVHMQMRSVLKMHSKLAGV